MFHQLLPAWRGRRVLLPGGKDEMSRTMHMLLEEIGARPVSIDMLSGSEALCRALHAGRGILVIIPCLSALSSQQPEAQLAALQRLLIEAREAGTPLVMLLADAGAHQDHMLRPLVHYAAGVSQGLFGDAVSVQCLWHQGIPARAVCLSALKLGARYLSGDRTYTGIFTLKQNLTFHQSQT